MSNKHPNGPGVAVRDNNVDQALRALKKKLQREGVFRELKLKQHYEKPSEERNRKKSESQRRARKKAVADFAKANGVSKQEATVMMRKERKLRR